MRHSNLIAFVLFFLNSCSNMLYFPAKETLSDPKMFGFSHVEHSIEVGSKNETVFIWQFMAKKQPARNVVVFFHGNAENMTSHWSSLRFLLEGSTDYVIFDYRGYGKSTGSPSPQKTVEDGMAVIKWTQNKFPKTPMIIFGQSLGGAVALRASWELRNEVKYKQIVVDSTFLSYKKIGQRVLSKPWITWPFQWLSYLLLSDEWAPRERIKDLAPTPIYVIHGTADQTVDFDLGQKVYETALEPKYFWPSEGALHTQSLWMKDQVIQNKFQDLFK